MKRFASIAIALVLAVGGLVGGAAASSFAAPAPSFQSLRESTAVPSVAPSDDPLLSPAGQQAIDDLRQCLASNSTLDVYYLLDASGSLFHKTNQVGTDPNNVRSQLIANSLTELASLQEGLNLNYALGFFGTRYVPSIPWTNVPQGTVDAQAAAVQQTIQNQGSLGSTNWKAAIAGAREQLAAQKAVSNGCQVLVWLTDGGINIDGTNKQDGSALNDMCGAPVWPGGAPPASGFGIFNQMRQSGIVVIGVLLRVKGGAGSARDAPYIPYMRPLVEGSGTVGTGPITCGQSPVPAGYAHGALVTATSASDLALIFYQLGAVLQGGQLYPDPFDADGHFRVDVGVSSFSLVTASNDWSLTTPSGTTYTASSPGPLKVDAAAAASKITFFSTGPDDGGTWTWKSSQPAADNLYFFSGLKVRLNAPSLFLAGADNVLTGRITRTDSRTVPLSDYSFSVQFARVTSAGAKKVSVDPITPDRQTGEFSIHYPASGAVAGPLTVQVSLTGLATKPTGVKLASVSTVLTLTVTVPDEYPTITPSTVKLSDLEGASGKAVGTIVVSAPADGSKGQVCFPKGVAPTIVSDAADRAASWKWALSGTLTKNCLAIAGGSIRLHLTATNTSAANSRVSASLPVSLVSQAGKQLPGSVGIEFTSTRPLNAVAFGLATLLLLVGGILLPLVGLWLLNFATHKISWGQRVMRAAIPVTVDSSGVLRSSVTGEELRTMAFGTDEFRFADSNHDARTIPDGALGTLRARVPLNPFGKPWFEIVPPTGRLVLGPSGYLPASRRAAADRGSVAGFGGDLGKVWGLVIAESALRSRTAGSDPVVGTLVVYLRNSASDASAFRQRMVDVLVPVELKPRLDRARARLADEPTKKVKTPVRKKGVSGSQPIVSDPGSRPVNPDDPPRRTGTSPMSDPPRSTPPRGGSATAPPPASSPPPTSSPTRYSTDPPPSRPPRDDPPPSSTRSSDPPPPRRG